MLQLDNVTTADGYSEANSLTWADADTLEIAVANAAIYAQFRPADPERLNELPFGDEFLLLPGSARVYDGVAGMRVRSAVMGAPAQVVAMLLGPGDPRPAGGASPLGLLLDPDGAVTPATDTLIALTGDVAANGAITAGAGFEVNKTATGTYVVTFDSSLGATPVVLANFTSATGQVIAVTARSTTSFTLTTRTGTPSVLADCAFNFVVVRIQ